MSDENICDQCADSTLSQFNRRGYHSLDNALLHNQGIFRAKIERF